MGCGTLISVIAHPYRQPSVACELGCEINRTGDHIALRRLLLAAGAECDICEHGFNAMLFCGWKKAGIWSAELPVTRPV